MRKLAILDFGDTKATNEVLSILEAALDEGNLPPDSADYYHATKVSQLYELKGKYDLIVALGSDAMRKLCKVDKTLKEYAGCLTYNEGLETWVLPTYHPNGIYQERYTDFDFTYDHIKRAIDLCTGVLEFPPIGGHKMEWEWLGHNGEGWDPNQGYDPKVWTGYAEATEQEVAKAVEIFSKWLGDLDDPA